MKQHFLYLIALFCSVSAIAQNTDDIGRITIQAFVPTVDESIAESTNYLQSKLSQIITAEGIADNEYCERFVLTAKIHVITKDIVAGPPHRVSQKLEVVLILGDIKEDKVYSTLTIPLVGVGLNENKAIISAFKNISINDEKVKKFLQEGKDKIISFYQNQGPILIQNAKALANQQKYEEALWTLAEIPEVCREHYEDACTLSTSIYLQMINSNGAVLLKKAQSAWAQRPNKYGAHEALDYISQINVSSSCMPQVNTLVDEITNKQISDDKREWEFKLEQYRDAQQRAAQELDYAQQRYKERQQTNRVYINACRDVAVAYFNNRPKITNYYTRIYNW